MAKYTEEDLAEMRAIHEALDKVPWADVTAVKGHLLTRWVVVAEFYDPSEDEHSIIRVQQENMQIWDARGFLHEALRDWGDGGDAP